jgi:hypothetical protein
MRSFALVLMALLPGCQNPSLPPLNPSPSPSGIAPSAAPVTPKPSPTADTKPNPTPEPHPTPSAYPTPTPFPTPSVIPGPPEPNPWPTGIGVRPSGAPVPTAPPEPAPHPGACSSCTITWHEATQPVWLGSKLLFTDQNKQRTIDMDSPLGIIRTNIYPQIKQVAQPVSQAVWPSSTQLIHGDWNIYPLSSQEILVKRVVGSNQEPSLQLIQLTPQVQAHTLPTPNIVFQVAPGPNQTLAWLQYANSSSQLDLYTSSLQNWNPTKIGVAQVAGADQLQWMPQGQGWAYLELNQPDPPKPLIYRMSPEGQQSLWLTLPQVGPWPNKIRSFKFSPDGQHLAVIVDSMTVTADNGGIYWKGVLWLGDATGQNLRQIQTERFEPDFDWSPDNQKLVVVAGKGEKFESTHQGVYSIQVSDGKTQLITGGNEAAVKYASPRWSPDGQQIAFTSNQKSDFRWWLEQPMELFMVKPNGDNLQRLSESRYQVEPLPGRS